MISRVDISRWVFPQPHPVVVLRPSVPVPRPNACSFAHIDTDPDANTGRYLWWGKQEIAPGKAIMPT